MLQRLEIINYALIDRTDVEFGSGFSVITGETGAGKSILLEALNLVLGSRANFNAIRKGQEKCSVEALFQYDDQRINALLDREHLDVMDDLILRRELTSSGRSRAFVNDSPVNVSILRDLANLLIDVHGQQENLSLQTSDYQLRQLDLFSGNSDRMEQYAEAYHSWKSLNRQLEQLREAAVQVRKDEDYFRFQLEELSSIELNAEEFEGIEGEMSELEHAEDIQKALSYVQSALDNDEEGGLRALRLALQELGGIKEYSEKAKDLYNRLQSSIIELEDQLSDVSRLESSIDADPKRLEILRDKIDVYQRLMHKHNVQTVSELIEVRDEYRIKLDGIESYEAEVEELEKKISEAHAKATEIAHKLGEVRRQAAPKLSSKLIEILKLLGMTKAVVDIAFVQQEELTSGGLERVDFMFDANGSKHLTALKESASGGEVSRFMLALKSILAEHDQTPTLVFDEIDTGVSGEVAKQIGKLMNSISKSAQIISVTHLPGVAAKGNHHIRIAKHEAEDGMISRLEVLQDEERVKEIAHMFSGHKLTDASLESARNLLQDS